MLAAVHSYVILIDTHCNKKQRLWRESKTTENHWTPGELRDLLKMARRPNFGSRPNKCWTTVLYEKNIFGVNYKVYNIWLATQQLDSQVMFEWLLSMSLSHFLVGCQDILVGIYIEGPFLQCNVCPNQMLARWIINMLCVLTTLRYVISRGISGGLKNSIVCICYG